MIMLGLFCMCANSSNSFGPIKTRFTLIKNGCMTHVISRPSAVLSIRLTRLNPRGPV